MAHIGTARSRMVLCTLAVLGLLSFDTQPVAACSITCGYFLPTDGATIPSNTPALPFMHGSPDTGEVRLTRIDGERMEQQSISLERVEAKLEFARELTLIRPSALVEGGRYKLEAIAEPSGCTSRPVTFDVGPKADLPTAVGRLIATYSRNEEISIACPTNPSFWGARSELYVSIEEEVSPWRELLLYRSVVDDKAGPFQSGITSKFNRPQDEVLRQCDEHAESRDSETHEVYVEALLPGVTDTLKTPVVSLTLTCEAERVKRESTRSDAVTADAGASDAPPLQLAPAAAEGCGVLRASAQNTRARIWLPLSCILGLALVRRRHRLPGRGRRDKAAAS